jgi:hypothetical protein
MPIKQNIGPYRFGRLAGRYTLSVSVGLIPHDRRTVFAPETRTFAGNMEFPLRFTTPLVGTKARGAIMVAQVRKATAAGLSGQP